MTDPAQIAHQAAHTLAQLTGTPTHDIAVVLGTGWGPVADELGTPTVEIPCTALPGFVAPQVAAHAGMVRSVPLNGRRILVFLGRTHGYEGHGVAQVVHAVRTACAAGVRVVVLTSAVGGIAEGLTVGQPVLISDHLNLTATSPLVGARFVDLTDTYSPGLRALARKIDSTLVEGVYAGVSGPHFETPAEIRMLRMLGADVVGMSTVLEAITARAEGAEVLGISLVVNLAAGLTAARLDVHDILTTATAAAARTTPLLHAILTRA